MINVHLNDNLTSLISSKLGLSVENVKYINNLYNSQMSDLMEKQYLAHSICAIEQFAFDDKNGRVHITHQALPSCRVPCYVHRGIYFHIVYPASFNSDEIRMCIAHELGHLFFNTQARRGEYNKDEKKLEAIANVFGLLVIFGRSELYSGKVDTFGNMSKEDIVEKYTKLCRVEC
jgi:Zn-dependent peptidase ImmA (M78 family)